ALIAYAGLGVAKVAFLNNENIFYPGIVMAILLYFSIKKFRWHPVVYIAISAVIGVIFKFQI
ncbi:MAG: chromate transporter, partial [Clostridia bacterium]|nr:chromate transporter [Clostridia bacterium]